MVPRTLFASLLVACVLIAGCTAAPAEQPAAPPAGGGMGGSGMGGDSGEGGGMVEGVVATPANAIIEMGSGSRVSSEGVSVARVVAPADGWVVVNSVESPGSTLGKAWVPKGESRNVIVKLDAADGPRARVSLHVDRGTKRTYEFDPERPLRSPDAQVFVDRTPVQTALSLTGFGVDVLANSALVLVEDQPAGTRSVEGRLSAWSRSVVGLGYRHQGRPARRACSAERGAPRASTSRSLVPLDEVSSPGEVLVTVHQDAGTRSRFEFDPADPLGSADQPYRSAGEIVSKRIRAHRQVGACVRPAARMSPRLPDCSRATAVRQPNATACRFRCGQTVECAERGR